jgi:N-acetyl sugar amidotransferase
MNINYTEILKTVLPREPYQICTKTVMDTSDPLITFDNEGVCNHVREYENYVKYQKPDFENSRILTEKMIDLLRKEGKGKDYDCIIGLSGGVDSSYLTWYVSTQLGLRPLIVHVDAGWNTETAVSNIQNIVQRLKLDLHTLVIDWEIIKDLQLSYFKSSLANLDVPQDHAFIASLYKEARKYGIRYIINGNNMATESILPSSWGYDASDSVQLKCIHKKFGSTKLKSYPILTTFDKFVYYPRILKLESFSPLDWIDYKKHDAKRLLISELGWKDYGGKHHESIFTRFFQGHYLPTKFGYDKRKAHLSSLIVSGQLSRDEALEELKKPLYDPIQLQDDLNFFIKKMGISLDEYNRIMNLPVKSYKEFPNTESLINSIRKVYHPIKKLLNK